MSRNLKELMEKTLSATEYVMHINEPFKDKFLERMKNYELKEGVVKELKKYADRLFVLVFSAEWCKDCVANIPILALLEEKSGLKVGVFGGLEKGTLNFKEKDGKPLSLSVAKEFGIERIPHIVIFDIKGRELGKIIENPSPSKTLEEEILDLATG